MDLVPAGATQPDDFAFEVDTHFGRVGFTLADVTRRGQVSFQTRDSVRKAQHDVHEAWRSGDHFLASLGMTDVEVAGAELAMELPVTGRLANTRGTLQGGIIASRSTWWPADWP